MDKQEFEWDWAKRVGVNPVTSLEVWGLVAVRCRCGEPDCKGWRMELDADGTIARVLDALGMDEHTTASVEIDDDLDEKMCVPVSEMICEAIAEHGAGAPRGARWRAWAHPLGFILMLHWTRRNRDHGWQYVIDPRKLILQLSPTVLEHAVRDAVHKAQMGESQLRESKRGAACHAKQR